MACRHNTQQQLIFIEAGTRDRKVEQTVMNTDRQGRVRI
jgi:hypothetical protein